MVSVVVQTPFNEYDGNGVTTVYPYSFQLLASTDLVVKVGGIVQVSGFTVSGIGNQSGGNVTFTTPPPVGTKNVLLSRELKLERDTDYQYNGDLREETIDRDFNRLWQVAQGQDAIQDGTLRAPYPEQLNTLPAAASRANTVQAYDGSGQPTVQVPASGSAADVLLQLANDTDPLKGAALVANAVARIETVAALRALPAPTRKTVVYLEGYYAAGDSEQGALLWVPASNKADNGVTVFQPNSLPASGRWERGPYGITSAWAGAPAATATDTTTRLQAAITAARLQSGDMRTLTITKGTYATNLNLVIESNQHIVFEPGVVIDASGLPNETTSAFSFADQTNVTLEGNGALIKGARATANPAIEGNSAGFYAYGSDNVLIRDFTVRDFATDGITLTGDNGASGPCTNVRIEGCDCYNNRRNGLSIIHAIGVVVDGGRYWNSNGAPSGPWAGIDVEPNANEVAQDILIQGVRTQDNAGPGLLLVPSGQSASAGTEFDVTVVGYRSQNDGAVSGMPALRFASGGAWTNQVFGQITVENAVIVSPKAMGVGFTNWDADKVPRTILRNVQVLNPDGTSSAAGNANRTGFVVYCDAAQAVTNQGNIVFENCRAEDMRGVPRMVWGFYLEADAGKTLKNIRARNPKSVNFTAASKYDVNVGATTNGGCTDVDVTYDSPVMVTQGTTTISGFVGKRIKSSAIGNAFTLPALAKSIGCHYEVFAPTGITGVSILGNGAELIKANGAAANNNLAMSAGDCWRVWNPDGLQWVARAEARRLLDVRGRGIPLVHLAFG